MSVDPNARRRKHLNRFRKAQGDAPECLGHYAAGDVECDGDPVCSWRGGCRGLRDWAAAIGVDPDAVKAHTPRRAVVSLVFDLLQAGLPSFSRGHDRNARAWTMYLEAFSDALPATIVVAPHRDAALDGDLYIHEWANVDRARAWMIRQRAAGKAPSRDPTLARYWPGSHGRVLPRIELRAQVDQVLARWPQIKPAAARWSHVSRGGLLNTGKMQCSAINVSPERIPDFGRLTAALLMCGVVDDMGRWPRKRIPIAFAQGDTDGPDNA